jgi:hypothetical protein
MRIKITLPSGATCFVRALTGQDFVLHGIDIPLLYGAEKRSNGKPTKKEIEGGVQWVRIALLAACSPLTLPDSSRLRIVDKDLDLCTDGEISIGELSDRDVGFIFDRVVELSGAGKEDAAKAATFPAETTGAAVDRSTGVEIQPAAYGVIVTAAG